MTGIPYRRGLGWDRLLIDIKDDHRAGCLCDRSEWSRSGWGQSGAAMRDHPLPAAPVYAGRSR